MLIVLDSGRTSAGRVGDQPKLDHSMDAALLLAALASRAGDRVDLLIADRDVRASVLRKLGSGDPALVRQRDGRASSRCWSRPTTGSWSPRSPSGSPSARLIVILTGLDEAAITEGLVPVLGPLRRKHKIVLAAVSDPRVDALAAGRDDAGEVYAAAAAESDRMRRARTAAYPPQPRHLGGPGAAGDASPRLWPTTTSP